MPSYSEAIQAMTSFFHAAWVDTAPVIWGDDDDTAKPNNEPWLRFNARHVDGDQVSMGAPGANRFEAVGTVTIQIFQPSGKEGLEAQAIADAVLGIYKGASSGGVHYSRVRANEVGNDGHGWYQINVLADFRYEQIT